MNAELIEKGNERTSLSRQLLEADEKKQIAEQRLAEIEVKLRMSIGALFRKIIIRDENFRNKLIEDHRWTPSTPAIPCEWSRTVGDVRDAAERFFAQGHDTVIIPLLIRENGAVKLVVGAMVKDSERFSAGEDIAKMASAVTMEDLHKTVSLNGDWDIAELNESDTAPFQL
ncbi:hypothetical protein ACUW8P_001860 [Corynebacterium afermentans]